MTTKAASPKASAAKGIGKAAVAKAAKAPTAKAPTAKPRAAKAAAPAPAVAPSPAAQKPAPRKRPSKTATGKTATGNTATGKTATGKPAASKAVPAKAATRAKKPTPVAAPARQKKRQKVSPPLLERLVAAAVESLESDKAENVVVLDIATRSSFADRMIVATGLADRQISAMATHVMDAMEALGIRRIRTEASPDWVLLDAGDIILHLFKPEARAIYGLERMWGPDSPAGESIAPPAPEHDDEA